MAGFSQHREGEECPTESTQEPPPALQQQTPSGATFGFSHNIPAWQNVWFRSTGSCKPCRLEGRLSQQRPFCTSQALWSPGSSLSHPLKPSATHHTQHHSCCPALCLRPSPPTILPTSQLLPNLINKALAPLPCPCQQSPSQNAVLTQPMPLGQTHLGTLLHFVHAEGKLVVWQIPWYLLPGFVFVCFCLFCFVFSRFNLWRANRPWQESNLPTQKTTEQSEKPAVKQKEFLKLHSCQSCHFTTNIHTIF